MIELYCKNCGGTLNLIGDDFYKCENCGATYTQLSAKKQQELLDSFLNKQKQDKLNNLRRHLWQEATAKYIDSSKIIPICIEIKNIYPNDFLANFYEIACGKNSVATVEFIDNIDTEENYSSIEQVVNFLIKSLKSEYLLSVNNLIERAYKQTDLATYNRLTTAFAKQAELVEEGVYETNIPRDVFVAYSSADMQYVQQVVSALEEQGIVCFVAMRNLQHGAGAVDNYQRALESAMDNCKILLFISSKNSRSLKCDAVKHELPYLKKSDLLKLSLKFPNVPYEKIDYKYKKPRIQWRIDDSKSLAVDRLIGEIFSGLEYCYSVDSVVERVGEYLFGEPDSEDESLAIQKQLEEQNKLLQQQLKQQQEFLKQQAEEQEKRFKKQAEEQEKRFQKQVEEQEKLKEEIKKQTLSATNNVSSAGLKTAENVSSLTAERKDGYAVGNIVRFGAYYQSNTKDKEPIEWKVLEIKDNKALLISKYALDCKRFNNVKESVSFYKSSLRTWLNEDFLNTAFSAQEQTKIALDSSGDKVSLLGSVLINQYFPTKEERICKPTSYAFIKGAYRGEGACFWWLVDKAGANKVYDVDYTGSVSTFGNDVNLTNRCVRPIIWVNLDDTKQKSEEKQKTKQIKSLKTVSVGDLIQFGKYPINSADKKEDIDWIVLDKKDGKLLVISKYSIDRKPFDDTRTLIKSWERSSIRKWLNGGFIEDNFTEEERKLMATVEVIAEKNPKKGTTSGSNTQDRVFLLSAQEVEKYLTTKDLLNGEHTAYAKSIFNGYSKDWWLRNAGNDSAHVMIASEKEIGYFGDLAGKKDNGIRPAMWIQIEESKAVKKKAQESTSLSNTQKVESATTTTQTKATTSKATATKTTESKNDNKNEKEPTKKSSTTAQAKTLAQTTAKKEDDKYKKGAIITFGSYPQSSSIEKEPIEWKVIKRLNNKALLISKYVLDAKLFHSKNEDVTWENCTLRSWLNNDFFNTAFLDKEKEQIVTATVEAHPNPRCETSPGNPTNDKVFILSLTEAETYFTSDRTRACPATSYAKTCKAWYDYKSGNAIWWLRTPGTQSNRATQVSMGGFVLGGGATVNGGSALYIEGVRPAIWVYTDKTREPTNNNLNKVETPGSTKGVEAKDKKIVENTPLNSAENKLTPLKVEADKTAEQKVEQAKVLEKTDLAQNTKTQDNSLYKVGDYIKYGYYPQASAISRMPIEWKIIDKQGSKLLLISRYALDSKKFNESYVDTVWQSSTLRAWLNGKFIDRAFTTEQIKGISLTTVNPEARPETIGSIGAPTTDKVFILSISEAEKYFKTNAERGAIPTAYAKNRGVYSYDGRCCYWLRNVGNKMAVDVYHGGHVDKNGYSIISTIPAVRPAMWIDAEFVKYGLSKNVVPVKKEENSNLAKAESEKSPKVAPQSNEKSLKDAKIGDIITFGAYYQNTLDKKEPIEWIVISKGEKQALLLSKMGLANKKFNEKSEKVSWKDCTLERWLNTEFLKAAFTEEQQNKIHITTVFSEKLTLFKKIKSDGYTYSKVFVLNEGQVKEYLKDYQLRKCKATPLAVKSGAYVYKTNGNSWWWLNTPGSDAKKICCVLNDGTIDGFGVDNSSADGVVRPAIWLNY